MSTLPRHSHHRVCLSGVLAALFLGHVATGPAASQQMPGMTMPPASSPVVTDSAPPVLPPAAAPRSTIENVKPKPQPDLAPTGKLSAPMAPMSDMPSPVAPPGEDIEGMPGMSIPSNGAPPTKTTAPMQGGQAPADARDPFAYSGGYQRSSMPGAETSDRLQVGAIFIEQLEVVETDQGSGAAWDAQARYGGPFDKLWLRTQGDRRQGTTESASLEAFWFRMYDPFWGTQVGVRHDFGEGPNRTWAALGIQGVTPYWFDVEATAYLGEQGRTAARLKTAFDLRLTQSLVLRPDLEVNLYGRSDPARQIGSGLATVQLGMRLRYEILREFGPYIGVAWNRGFGETGDLRRASGGRTDEVQAVVGVQIWR